MMNANLINLFSTKKTKDIITQIAVKTITLINNLNNKLFLSFIPFIVENLFIPIISNINVSAITTKSLMNNVKIPSKNVSKALCISFLFVATIGEMQ